MGFFLVFLYLLSIICPNCPEHAVIFSPIQFLCISVAGGDICPGASLAAPQWRVPGPSLSHTVHTQSSSAAGPPPLESTEGKHLGNGLKREDDHKAWAVGESWQPYPRENTLFTWAKDSVLGLGLRNGEEKTGETRDSLQERKRKVKSLSCVRLLVTPWTVAYQAPPSMGFSRQGYWSGFPSPGDLPNSGIEPRRFTVWTIREAGVKFK